MTGCDVKFYSEAGLVSFYRDRNGCEAAKQRERREFDPEFCPLDSRLCQIRAFFVSIGALCLSVCLSVRLSIRLSPSRAVEPFRSATVARSNRFSRSQGGGSRNRLVQFSTRKAPAAAENAPKIVIVVCYCHKENLDEDENDDDAYDDHRFVPTCPDACGLPTTRTIR